MSFPIWGRFCLAAVQFRSAQEPSRSAAGQDVSLKRPSYRIQISYLNFRFSIPGFWGLGFRVELGLGWGLWFSLGFNCLLRGLWGNGLGF